MSRIDPVRARSPKTIDAKTHIGSIVSPGRVGSDRDAGFPVLF
jgi:hypothetical protein